MTPLVSDPDFTLHVGDVRDVLQTLPDESVDCVVTSPPYWGLRDYGTGEWEGGDAECDHRSPTMREGRNEDRAKLRGSEATNAAQLLLAHRSECGKCGAIKVDSQLGLEPTPEEYVANMVAVFREVRRVLRPDGTCWVNLGDSYNSTEARKSYGDQSTRYTAENHGGQKRPLIEGLKVKDLVGMPWRVAFALQADGWYLRSDIIWAKPNPMPESVTDRPTKAHEYVFLLTKSPRYFFDQEAVREAHVREWGANNGGTFGGTDWMKDANRIQGGRGNSHNEPVLPNPAGRNIRSVWEIATQPYPEAHFATYPEALVERCLKAGTSERGCCPECGALWVREVERGEAKVDPRVWSAKGATQYDDGIRGMKVMDGTGSTLKHVVPRETTGWKPSCSHGGIATPCVVLDPFLGSGTTALVARRLGRKCIGIELSPEYAGLAAKRLQQLSLLAEA